MVTYSYRVEHFPPELAVDWWLWLNLLLWSIHAGLLPPS